jgi:MoaA/NifB/PqqE/SkfB family radical SAM enzyme
LKEWYENGLTTITISVVSNRTEVNQKIYMPNSEYIDLPDLIKYLHSFGFSLRLTCVCCKDMMDTPDKVEEFIKFAKENKVEQVTLRPVNDEFRRKSAADWIAKNKLTKKQKLKIKKYLEKNGTRLLELERIGTIYDIFGQNVCLSLPLNKYTRDTNPENARNLIFFQDGHIRYEWEMEGGILL